MSPATKKQALALYVGPVYWFAPDLASLPRPRPAHQLWPMSGQILLDVYGTAPVKAKISQNFNDPLSHIELSF